MSTVNFKDGKFFWQTDDGNSELLVDTLDSSLNKSSVHSHQFTDGKSVEYPLSKIVTRATKEIFKQTIDSMAELTIYLRTVARLLTKPQIHHVLHVGNWSPLDDAFAEILPLFNPENKIYCLSTTRPLGKVSSAIFLCAEGGEFPLPAKKFDTIIFTEHKTPSSEIFLSAKDDGKIYFVERTTELEDFLLPSTKIFSLTETAALFETEMTPLLRQEIFLKTPQAQLEVQTLVVKKTVAKFLSLAKKINTLTMRADRMILLDDYLAEVTRAEKILAEIFPELRSDTVKFNFNLFKEFLLDVRLVPDANSQRISAARAVRQHEILTRDLSNS